MTYYYYYPFLKAYSSYNTQSANWQRKETHTAQAIHRKIIHRNKFRQTQSSSAKCASRS